MHAPDGVLTVTILTKLADQYFLTKSSPMPMTKWNSWLPRKINIFIWRALQDRLPSSLQLAIRGSIKCSRCSCEVETLNHAIVECLAATGCWKSLFAWCDGPPFRWPKCYACFVNNDSSPMHYKATSSTMGCNKKGVCMVLMAVSKRNNL